MKSSDKDGNELWEKVRNGDLKAFDQIYHLHINRLLAYGRSLYTDVNTVKDATQNVFIQLWRGRHSIKIKTSLTHYLLISLRNDLIRQSKKKVVLKPLVDMDSIEQSEASAEDETIKKEEHEALRAHLYAHLMALSPRQREALYLKYQEQLSNEQISTIMGIKKNGVYKLIYTALSQLRKKM